MDVPQSFLAAIDKKYNFAAPYYRTLPPAKKLARTARPLTPGACAVAYGARSVDPSKVKPVKLGFVSLGGATSHSDVSRAFALYGLPEPNITKIFVDGAQESPDPGGADLENMLDACCLGAAWSAATGTPADITIAVAPNTDTGIADGHAALADAGVEVSSVSWGSPVWSSQARAYTEQRFSYCRSKGMWMLAASGDNSINDGTQSAAVDYPCGSAYIWAVGGTRLELAQNGSIAAERAWGDGRPGDEGGGGGFDPLTAQPAWQRGIVPGSSRGCPDSSGNADPASGYSIVENGQQTSVGGTSGASPLTAGLLGVIRGYMKGSVPIPLDLGPIFYPTSPFRDITTGSNGQPAKQGWDAATGLGTPDVARILAALLGQAPPVSPPPVGPPVNPPPPPVPVSGPTADQVVAAVDAEFQALEQAFSQRPFGMIVARALALSNQYVDATIRKVFGQ